MINRVCTHTAPIERSTLKRGGAASRYSASMGQRQGQHWSKGLGLARGLQHGGARSCAPTETYLQGLGQGSVLSGHSDATFRASAPAHTTVVRGGGGDRHRGCPSVPDLLQISSGPTEDGRCD